MRERLNKHLTNNVILRIDYVPLPDEKVDEINNIIAQEFLVKESIFTEVKQTFIRNIDIQMNDPSIQDFNEFINLKEKSRIRSYEYYKLTDENIEIKLTFNRQFCSIDVNQMTKYYEYEKYRDIFINILELLKDKEIIINRFGLRKFNDFFIKETANINDYVKDKYFCLECNDLIEESYSIITEKRWSFSKEVYNTNLITHSSIGKLESDIVKRIAFDIDVYITDITELQKLFTEDNIEFVDKVNNLIFKVYINLLTEKMIKLLCKESELNDENIVFGVDYNEDN